ncbi:MAG: hypothetical protein CMO97_00665 [Woeseia sp.]|nr:hypothetical protein [Woeseia sp.]|tara:strand:+ start:1345 stop:1557 length:213 start_codon:yes stop_codon:yes gene_type:complete
MLKKINKNTMKLTFLILSVPILIFFISGCGQSGPLYIPDNSGQINFVSLENKNLIVEDKIYEEKFKDYEQ